MKCGAKCDTLTIMVLYYTAILALLVNQYAAKLLEDSAQPHNIDDLAELIQRVADGEEKPMDRMAIDMDYFSTDDTYRTVLDSIMTLLGKNLLPQDEGVRIHVIKNPGVLQEYQGGLRRRRFKQRLRTTTARNANAWDSDGPLSDLSSLARNDYSDRDDEGVFRRKNGFRNSVDGRSIRQKHTNSKNKKEREENISNEDQVIHFVTKRASEKRDKENNSNERKPQNERHKKDRDEKEWDMVTHKWDMDKKERTDKNRQNVDKRVEKRQRASYEDSKPRRLRNEWSNRPSVNSGRWENERDVAKAKSIRESFNDEQPQEHKVMKADWKIKDKFNKETTYEMPTYKTTKERSRSKNKVPEIADYYQPSKPRNRGRINKNFGRTSIPFVGKKGIYEE